MAAIPKHNGRRLSARNRPRRNEEASRANQVTSEMPTIMIIYPVFTP